MTAVALTAPVLFLGGALARAAESPSQDGPTSASVTYTDANGQPVGSGDTTTTTSGAGSTPFSTAQDVSVSVNGSGGNTDPTGNTGSAGSSLEQTISVSVLPGSLTISPSSESISLSNTHAQDNGGPLMGSLSTITVVDARGSLVGWDATVSLQSVDGLNASDLAGAKLCVRPDVVTVVAGIPPEVKSGQHACAKAGDPLTLFYAPPNGGGGTFSDTGGLTLDLPEGATAGPATATLAVAVH